MTTQSNDRDGAAFDAAVAGGGIAGLSAAWFMARRGLRVLLLEAETCGAGTTRAAAGMLAPVHELEFQETELLAAGRASLARYARWERELPPFGLERRGALEAALTRDDLAYLRRSYEFQLRNGLAVEWMEGPALKDLEPFLDRRIPAAVFAPDDAQLDNRRLTSVLVQDLRSRGVAIHERTPLVDWRAEGAELALHTPGNAFRARKLLLATGAAPSPAALPFRVYPVKGQALALEPPAEPLLARPLRIRNKAYGNAYVVPKTDRIVLGSTSEEMGRETRLTAGGLMDILNKCYRALPGLYELFVQETWSGFRPATLERTPAIGKLPDVPVYYANGLYRHGILLAPLFGAAAAAFVDAGEILPEARLFVKEAR